MCTLTNFVSNQFSHLVKKSKILRNSRCYDKLFCVLDWSFVKKCKHFYFLLPISRESIVFGSNFRNGDIEGFTRFEVPWIRNHIFSKWSVCICVCLCVSVCVSVIRHNSKKITAESSNLASYISIIGRCYLKLFIKIGQKFCIQGHTKHSNAL